MVLTSKNNPLIRETVALQDKKGRKQLGLFLVEGVKMTRECLQSGLEVERVIASESFTDKDGLLADVQDKIVVVSDEVFARISDEKTPQGVLCRVKIPQTPLQSPTGACLVLDGVADPGNLGAIIRTANAAGYREIYLADGCADAYSPKSVRASMSGVFFTTLYHAGREEILSVLQDTGVIVADMRGENLFAFDAPETFALVIGNEANGVSETFKKAAAYTVKIPMEHTQESLNAAVSAGILMYNLKKFS